MSNIPFAPVTVVDTATSTSPLNSEVIGLDYRWAGNLTTQVTYAATLASVGTGDFILVQVSPDWKHDAPSNAGAMWVTYGAVSTASAAGTVVGPWSAIRFAKSGAQAGKVVAMVAGKQRNRADIQG